MKSQDLNVLINLAERCRKAGLIAFEEFDVVSTALRGAAQELAKNAEQSNVESKSKTSKTVKLEN